MKRFGIALFSIAVWIASGHGHAAEEKSACLSSYELGQRAKMDGRIRESREHFLQCANEGCPAALRPDCAKWLEEANAALASLVIRARDATGNEVLNVSVHEGETLIAPTLTGRALSLDPGRHTLRFQFADGTSVTREIILHEGERGAQLDVVSASQLVSTGSSGSSADSTSAQPSRPIPASVYIFGAVSVVGLASAGYFAIAANNEQFSMLHECRPHCSSDRVSKVKTSYLIADVSLAVSLASGILAGYFWATRPTVAATLSHVNVAVGPRDSHVQASFEW